MAIDYGWNFAQVFALFSKYLLLPLFVRCENGSIFNTCFGGSVCNPSTCLANQPKLTNRIVMFLLMKFTVERVICC